MRLEDAIVLATMIPSTLVAAVLSGVLSGVIEIESCFSVRYSLS